MGPRRTFEASPSVCGSFCRSYFSTPSAATDVCRDVSGASFDEVVPPATILPFAQQLDDMMVQSLQNFLGLNVSPLDRRQVLLPTKNGGFGLREGIKLAAAAFVTSFLKFRSQGVATLSIPPSLTRTASDLTAALTYLLEGLPPSAQPAFLWISDRLSSESFPFHPDFCSLSWWSAQFAARAYDEIIELSPARDRARLRCLAGCSCGAWLDACPCEALGLRIPGPENCVLAKLMLGQPIFPVDADLACNQCGDCMDPFGDHLLCCKKRLFGTAPRSNCLEPLACVHVGRLSCYLRGLVGWSHETSGLAAGALVGQRPMRRRCLSGAPARPVRPCAYCEDGVGGRCCHGRR